MPVLMVRRTMLSSAQRSVQREAPRSGGPRWRRSRTTGRQSVRRRQEAPHFPLLSAPAIRYQRGPGQQRGSNAAAKQVSRHGFAKGQSGNPRGRESASALIAATFHDLAVDFPNLAPHERVMLRNAASLLYRGERCRDSAVAHRCICRPADATCGRRSGSATPAKDDAGELPDAPDAPA
jgi:hypothetical protein